MYTILAIKQPATWKQYAQTKKGPKTLLSLSNGPGEWQDYRTGSWLYLFYSRWKPWNKLYLSHFPPGALVTGVEPCQASLPCTNRGPLRRQTSGALSAIPTLTRQYPIPPGVTEMMKAMLAIPRLLLRWHLPSPRGTLETILSCTNTGRRRQCLSCTPPDTVETVQ